MVSFTGFLQNLLRVEAHCALSAKWHVFSAIARRCKQPTAVKPLSKREAGSLRIRAISRICLTAALVFNPIVAWSQSVPQGHARPSVVVLDPGHGGQDLGAQGPGGAVEKDVTLILARKIADILEADYRVILTRTDDFGVSLTDRTAIANNADADLFISLHTGASFSPSTSGAIVYNYADAAGAAREKERRSDPTPNAGMRFLPWERLQIPHLVLSRSLAREMQTSMQQLQPEKPIELAEAPLLVLESADMPAVLIEIGHLTHPSEENLLREEPYLQKLAVAISQGIRYFLRTKIDGQTGFRPAAGLARRAKGW